MRRNCSSDQEKLEHLLRIEIGKKYWGLETCRKSYIHTSTLKKSKQYVHIPTFFFLKGPGRPDFRSSVDRGQSEIARIEFLSS